MLLLNTTRRNWTTRPATTPISLASLRLPKQPSPWTPKQDAEQLVDGEYDLEANSLEVEQHDEENEFWDYDCDAYEIRIFNLQLRNPSAEATQLMEEVRIEKELVVALRDVLDGEGIKKSWRNCPQQAFIKEHAKELVKALTSQTN